MAAAGYVAAVLSAIWAAVHMFVGGAEVAGPLLASDLPEVVRATGWMVWHMVTGVLWMMAIGFWLSTYRGSRDGLIVLSAIACTLAGAGLMAAAVTAGLGVLPQGLLFVPVAVLGLLAAPGLARREASA